MLEGKVDSSLLVLFVRLDCEFCKQAQDLVSGVMDANIVTYMVFDSRIEGKVEIRPSGQKLAGMPLLVDDRQIPSVPCLYDPTLDEKIFGIEQIETYLIESGLI